MGPTRRWTFARVTAENAAPMFLTFFSELKQAGLPASKVENFYRPPKKPEIICETCGGLGFKGRIGVFELLVMTERMRDLIRERANISAVKAEARKNGMLYMRDEGLRLVAMGVTSVEEMMRVVK